MKDRYKKFFIVSLVFNIFICAGVLYWHRAGIKKRFDNILYAHKQQKIESLAADMNQQIFTPVYDRYDIGAKETIRIAFIGNSISLHYPYEDVGWSHVSGMAASSLETDYIHRTVTKIATGKHMNVEYAIMNISDWEREFETFDINRITGINDFNPDYTVFQLGENLTQLDIETKSEVFIDKYKNLIDYIKTNENEIICLPFWYSKEKV